MLSATRQDIIMDTMLPVIARDSLMSWLLAQLVFILTVGTLLVASAQFKVMLPPSPGPITEQILVVLMIGMAYGSGLGVITVLAYLLASLCSLRYAGCVTRRQGCLTGVL